MTINKHLQIILNSIFPKQSKIKLEVKNDFTSDAYPIYGIEIIKNGKLVDYFTLPPHTVNKLVELDREKYDK